MAQGGDYVIVGGGAAGAVLAARLTEDPAAHVLVLEAGPDFRSEQTPPEFRTRDIDMSVERNPDFWWQRLTARRNPAQEPYYYPSGRGLGGGSTVNGLCAIRGCPDDYDEWARQGAKGWSYAEVLPSFTRLEDDHDYPDAPFHGRGGPIPIYRQAEHGWGGVDVAFRDALLDTGATWQDDHNAPDATGLSPFAMNIRDGRRVSTNDGYLEPARSRPNLTVKGECLVATLILDPGGTTVRGVELAGGEKIRVNPGGEVLVAAGGAHSPALLMRSGIGPAEDLTQLGVGVIADLPVGRGLQDHPMLMVKVPTAESTRHSLDNRVTNCILRYSSGLGGAGDNDMMLLPNNGGKAGHSWLIAQQEQVFSRGRLTLTSADPAAEPLIEQNLLTDERDAVRMRDAVDRIAELASHPDFAAIRTGPVEFPDKETLPDIIGDTVHIASTCRMGAPDDPATVVDPDCRVLGLDGVRVVDASIMPAVPRANPLLSVLMIAEHMAGRIRESRPIT